MERVRPLARIRGHVLCNTGHAGLCLKVAHLLSILLASKQDEYETISCTIFDSNDDIILLSGCSCLLHAEEFLNLKYPFTRVKTRRYFVYYPSVLKIGEYSPT